VILVEETPNYVESRPHDLEISTNADKRAYTNGKDLGIVHCRSSADDGKAIGHIVKKCRAVVKRNWKKLDGRSSRPN